MAFFWGLVGTWLVSPILLVSNAYTAIKTPPRYHLRGYYHHKRRFFLKRARIYAFFAVSGIVLSGALYLLP